jgi:hypothetical protein
MFNDALNHALGLQAISRLGLSRPNLANQHVTLRKSNGVAVDQSEEILVSNRGANRSVAIKQTPFVILLEGERHNGESCLPDFVDEQLIYFFRRWVRKRFGFLRVNLNLAFLVARDEKCRDSWLSKRLQYHSLGGIPHRQILIQPQNLQMYIDAFAVDREPDRVRRNTLNSVGFPAAQTFDQPNKTAADAGAGAPAMPIRSRSCTAAVTSSPEKMVTSWRPYV